MKAVRINEWGQPVQVEDIPQPAPGSDEVLVRVHAATINPFDLAVIAGMVRAMLNTPMTPGSDFAGEVVSVGAGGAVGSFATQFAKERGAYVIGCASPEKAQVAREAGVDQHVNYREQRLEDVERDVDVALVTGGADTTEHSFEVLKPGGRLVT